MGGKINLKFILKQPLGKFEHWVEWELALNVTSSLLRSQLALSDLCIRTGGWLHFPGLQFIPLADISNSLPWPPLPQNDCSLINSCTKPKQ